MAVVRKSSDHRGRITQFRPSYGSSRIATVVSARSESLVLDFEGNPYGPVNAQIVSALRGRRFEPGQQVLAVFTQDEPQRAVVIDEVVEFSGLSVAPVDSGSSISEKVSTMQSSEAPSDGQDATVSLPVSLRLAQISRIEDRDIYVVPHGNDQEVAVHWSAPLANLEDPVLLLALDAQAPIIVAQLSAGVSIDDVAAENAQLELHAHSIHLDAEQEISLSCGGSRITISATGRVETLGRSVVSRSEGVNKIQGASIQLN